MEQQSSAQDAAHKQEPRVGRTPFPDRAVCLLQGCVVLSGVQLDGQIRAPSLEPQKLHLGEEELQTHGTELNDDFHDSHSLHDRVICDMALQLVAQLVFVHVLARLEGQVGAKLFVLVQLPNDLGFRVLDALSLCGVHISQPTTCIPVVVGVPVSVRLFSATSTIPSVPSGVPVLLLLVLVVIVPVAIPVAMLPVLVFLVSVLSTSSTCAGRTLGDTALPRRV